MTFPASSARRSFSTPSSSHLATGQLPSQTITWHLTDSLPLLLAGAEGGEGGPQCLDAGARVEGGREVRDEVRADGAAGGVRQAQRHVVVVVGRGVPVVRQAGADGGVAALRPALSLMDKVTSSPSCRLSSPRSLPGHSISIQPESGSANEMLATETGFFSTYSLDASSRCST